MGGRKIAASIIQQAHGETGNFIGMCREDLISPPILRTRDLLAEMVSLRMGITGK